MASRSAARVLAWNGHFFCNGAGGASAALSKATRHRVPRTAHSPPAFCDSRSLRYAPVSRSKKAYCCRQHSCVAIWRGTTWSSAVFMVCRLWRASRLQLARVLRQDTTTSRRPAFQDDLPVRAVGGPWGSSWAHCDALGLKVSSAQIRS